MVATIDVSVGELYALVLDGEEAPVLAKFAEELPDDILLFRRLRTHKPIELELDEFERMRSDGRADRISTDRDGHIIPEREIDPLSFADPDEPGITLRERGVRLRKQEMLQRKRTLRFYVLRYDDMTSPTKGRAWYSRLNQGGSSGRYQCRFHMEAVTQQRPSRGGDLRYAEESTADSIPPRSAGT